jgi:hypothetical protein
VSLQAQACYNAATPPIQIDASQWVDDVKILTAYTSQQTIDPAAGWAQADVIAIQTSGMTPLLGIIGMSDGSRRYVTMDRQNGLSVTEYLGATNNSYYQGVEYWGDTATVRIKIKNGIVTYRQMPNGPEYTSPFPVVSTTPIVAYYGGGGGQNFFLANLIVGVKTCN